MSKYCEDCGTPLSSGVCSNCQEELYIVREQNEDICEPLSQQFIEKVEEQERLIRDRKATP